MNQDSTLILSGDAAASCLTALAAVRARAERDSRVADVVATSEFDELADVLAPFAILGSHSQVGVGEFLQRYTDLLPEAKAALRARIAEDPSLLYEEVVGAHGESSLDRWVVETAEELSPQARCYLTVASCLTGSALPKSMLRDLQSALRAGIDELEESAAVVLAPIVFSRPLFGRAVFQRQRDVLRVLNAEQIWLGYAERLHAARDLELEAIRCGELFDCVWIWSGDTNWAREATAGLDSDGVRTVAALCAAILADRRDLIECVFEYPARVSGIPAAIGIWAQHQDREGVSDLLSLLPERLRTPAQEYVSELIRYPGLLKAERGALCLGGLLKRIRCYRRWRWVPAPLRATKMWWRRPWW